VFDIKGIKVEAAQVTEWSAGAKAKLRQTSIQRQAIPRPGVDRNGRPQFSTVGKGDSHLGTTTNIIYAVAPIPSGRSKGSKSRSRTARRWFDSTRKDVNGPHRRMLAVFDGGRVELKITTTSDLNQGHDG
jgi:hypothetical protein